MDEKISKQHTQVPNEMSKNELDPKDQLIYLAIKSFQNGQTKLCNPSLQKIAERSGASIPTIRSSIKRLEDKEYISIKKNGRGQEYSFSPYKNFEPFSKKFLEKEDLSFTTKSYLVASQQYMFQDVQGFGKISFPNTELSEKINMPESTIRKCNQELKRKNYLTIIENESRDIETGCKTETKLFNLNELGQAVIWALKNHEDRITKNTSDIEYLRKELEQLKESNKQKDLLLSKIIKNNKNNEFIL